MQDPTSLKFLKTQRVHRSGLAVGQDRPFGRVTWAKGKLHGIASAKPGVGTLRYLDKTAAEEEFFGIRSIETDKSIGQDAGTATITMYNTRPDWAVPEGLDTEGNLGYLSPTRGAPHPVPKFSTFNSLDDDLSQFEAGLVGSPIVYPTSWQYSSNRYRDVLIPNTVIRTYQGYGSDNLDLFGNPYAPTDPHYVAPKHDSQLFRTGVWLIDKVTFTHAGDVTIECRDMAKVLIEQYVYPPLIPLSRFPLIYNPAHDASGHKESIGKNVATWHSSSVDAVYGKNHAIRGHRGSQAFDSSMHTYWLSGPNTSTGVEWIQARTKGAFNEIVLNAVHGHYVVYVSIHEGGKWLGTKHIAGNTENLSPGEGNGEAGYFYVITSGDTLWDLAGTYYGDNLLWPIIARANNNIIKDPHWIYPGQRIKIPYVKGTKSPPPAGSGTGGTRVNIPYVLRATVPGSGKVTIKLPKTYAKADYVRVVFTKLHKYATNDYRADLRNFAVHNHIKNTYKSSTVGKASYIRDWSEPIKEMLAWAGFTYFDTDQAANQGDTMQADPLLGRSKSGSPWLHQPGQTRSNSVPLRVWGDFEVLGAGPVASTPGDYFMNKSFKEAIQLVVDFLGAIFFIDESGGAQFRLPNIWGGGNFVDDPTAPVSVGAYVKNYPVEFHEDANLVSYSAVISDEALRSEILVVGGYPNIKSNVPIAGGTVLGYNSKTNTTSAIDFSNVLAGQYRLAMVPGDATKLFQTEIECQRMAELVALFILFTYRQGSLSAPCHPGLQLDDQVRIFERVTGESYVHYVSSIKTSQDLEAGSYTMNCTTHWLGSDPNTDWFVNKQQLTPAVSSLPSILARVGQQAPDDTSLPAATPTPAPLPPPPPVPRAPVADFTFSVSGSVVTFHDTGTRAFVPATVASRAWQFGDGAIASGSAPTHSYAAAGTYAVQLTVTDSDGMSTSVTYNVTIGVTPPPPPPPPGITSPSSIFTTLAFHDEFDAASLDTSKWNINQYQLPYEMSESLASNVTLRDSSLVIPAIRTTGPHGRPWTSAYVDTRGGKFSQKYGRFEARIKINTTAGNSSGLWPAFWLRPDDTSFTGEIDIMEAWGEPSSGYATQVYPAGGAFTSLLADTNHTDNRKQTITLQPPAGRLSDDFHTYALEWTATTMAVYLDNVQVGPTLNPTSMPWWNNYETAFHIRLQMQVGQLLHSYPDLTPGYWGTPTSGTISHSEMLVDWVRVWGP